MSNLSQSREGGRSALRALARLHGLQPSFVGADGRRHRPSDEITIQLLRALRVPIGDPSEAAELAALARARRASRVVEPVLVERDSTPARHRVTLPVDRGTDGAWVELVGEDGSSERHRLGDLVQGPSVREEVDGRSVAHLEVRLPSPLAAGYHQLRIEAEGLEAAALLIRAPGRCPLPERCWGLFAPVHALRGEDDWGVGSYGELGKFMAWSGQLGARFVSTLPIFATFLDGPVQEPSPYLPVSRLAWNELYLDIATLPEIAYSAEVRSCLESGDTRDTMASLRRTRLADPIRVMAAKRAVLQRAAAACVASPPRLRALEDWLAAHPEVAASRALSCRPLRTGRPGARALPRLRAVDGRLSTRRRGGTRQHLHGPARGGAPAGLRSLVAARRLRRRGQRRCATRRLRLRRAGLGHPAAAPPGHPRAGLRVRDRHAADGHASTRGSCGSTT